MAEQDEIPFYQKPEWADVVPIPQDDGPNPLVPIAYTSECMFFFFSSSLATWMCVASLCCICLSTLAFVTHWFPACFLLLLVGFLFLKNRFDHDGLLQGNVSSSGKE